VSRVHEVLVVGDKLCAYADTTALLFTLPREVTPLGDDDALALMEAVDAVLDRPCGEPACPERVSWLAAGAMNIDHDQDEPPTGRFFLSIEGGTQVQVTHCPWCGGRLT